MSSALSNEPPVSDDLQEEGSFVRRWSVRKGKARQSRDPEQPLDRVPLANEYRSAGHQTGPDPDHNLPAAEATDDEPLLTDADMLPVESIDTNSDLSPFFNRGVSANLRRAALRRLFRQPVFNIRDGLDDYDDDYTCFEPLGDTVTCDMKFHQARIERAEAERLMADDEAQREQEGTDVASDDATHEESEEMETASDVSTRAESEEIATADDDSTPGESEQTHLTRDDSTHAESEEIPESVTAHRPATGLKHDRA